MKLKYDGCSMRGAIRRRNEDAILIKCNDSTGLFLVADGIGGSAYGQEASGLIRDRYNDWWDERSWKADFFETVQEIKKLLYEINGEIYKKHGLYRSGATIVLLYIQEDNCFLLYSGDSRIYRARGLTCKQVTKDDIFENLPSGQSNIANKNNGKLVAAVGIGATVDYSTQTEPIKKGDRFLLCSDGVYKYHAEVSLRKKVAILGKYCSPKTLVRSVSKKVESNGAGDNYSMIFVSVS